LFAFAEEVLRVTRSRQALFAFAEEVLRVTRRRWNTDNQRHLVQNGRGAVEAIPDKLVEIDTGREVVHKGIQLGLRNFEGADWVEVHTRMEGEHFRRRLSGIGLTAEVRMEDRQEELKGQMICAFSSSK